MVPSFYCSQHQEQIRKKVDTGLGFDTFIVGAVGNLGLGYGRLHAAPCRLHKSCTPMLLSTPK